jgi:hypothetical protein
MGGLGFFVLGRLFVGQECLDPTGEDVDGLRADQRIGLATRVVHELEARRAIEAEGLPHCDPLLHLGVFAASGQTPLVGRHVGTDLLGNLGQEGTGLR